MDRRYDVLLCDADNTIFDFEQAEKNAFAIACTGAGIEPTADNLATYSRINDALWKLLERGGITQRELRVRRFEQFLASIGRADVPAAQMGEAFTDALAAQSVPVPGAVEAIREALGLGEETAVLPFSAEKGTGRDELLGMISSVI